MGAFFFLGGGGGGGKRAIANLEDTYFSGFFWKFYSCYGAFPFVAWGCACVAGK